MSLFSNSKNVTVTGGNFHTIAGNQNINVNIQRDDPAQRWQNCVEVFDIVDSSHRYGIDYEIARVKLEVERIRLLEWGNAVGFGTEDSNTSTFDARLDRAEIRNTVLRLLGCVHHVFEEAGRLQERYGLHQITADQQENELRILPLAAIFKRAYAPLIRSSKDRQSNTPLPQKKLWAIRDKKKFEDMINEIRGFNDSLDQLFPDIKKFTTESIKADIGQSDDVKALQSLQEATTGGHDEISESASVRLEAMGVTTITGSQIGEIPRVGENTIEDEAHLDEDNHPLRKLLQSADSLVSKKHLGRLTISVFGPDRYSAIVRARPYWDGQDSDSWWGNRDKGFIHSTHASFDLYFKKPYTRRSRDVSFDHTDEGSVLLDVECHSKHQNINPGTVTIEGFGLESWGYENAFGKPRENTILVSYAKMPEIQAKKLLRRINELSRGAQKFGWNPTQEEADLKEFFGTALTTRFGGRDRNIYLGDFYSALNRTDIFADFTSESLISMHWCGPRDTVIGIWYMLYQIILAKELALRIGSSENSGSYSGYTPRVLSALIVQDLWLRNVEIVLRDIRIAPQPLVTPENRIKAEVFKDQGNEALKNGQWQKAVDSYTEALKIDSNNAVYFSNRSAALLSLEDFDGAVYDAFVATRLDPKYAKAWSRLGLAELKRGYGNKAKAAYERAIEVAGSEATTLMKQGLADAKAKIAADIKAINEEKDQEKKDRLRKDFNDQDWDITYKTYEMHSCVHQQQVEGLLLFAEKMTWPYINEVRDYAEDVYGNLRSGGSCSLHVLDWLFGLTLPGKWMSFKIMATLVSCTPSISASLGTAEFYDCGLVLPKKSYWRVRTVLGRVLGCLPNVVSLCGWVGPCVIPIEFIPPLGDDGKKKPRYIHINARAFSSTMGYDDDEDGVIHLGRRRDYVDPLHLQPDEDLEDWIVAVKDDDKWICPQPPQREFVTCRIESIRLKKLPLDVNVATQQANGTLTDAEIEAKTKYRASIVFSLDNNEDTVIYTLYTNPVFVTPPPCHSGPHSVHARELSRYLKDVWMVERLKDHTPEDFDDDVMIINATGNGTELLARAWCAERGKNAVIRRAGGPCFGCSVRTAGKDGLGVGVLIWVS
ncbi:Small glutamine-rich tetratricopeptide repeat-containing protein 2 [Psilocybe cubensis]|uniref:Small glutamine-rich tetratricopeptide repeat-containing protein 2 n=2 Tax=Psilocybe cubensis TaxID=181762 RepID=A0ACB8GKQ6_PSICU|nr:Small glutamine-rich tetratricopeptide repeat-containing protein 2 [Psilocybe cubensis]KAH9476040.1 Small glutamine-rich tetratricopeptide repeat-containing protein 2 [Psilocybe cubensis]